MRDHVAPGEEVPPEMAVGRHLAEFVGAEHVGMVLSAGPGYQGVVRGSSPPLVDLAEMVESVGEGPTLEVLRTGLGSAVDDLRGTADRWPVLLSTYPPPAAVRTLVVLPLDGGTGGPARPEDVVGLLLLAREQPRPLPAPALSTVVRGAALLAGMVLARAEGSLDGAPVLDELLDPRADVVPRALGVMAQDHGLTPAQARRRLQAAAFTAGETLHAAARRLLAGEG